MKYTAIILISFFLGGLPSLCANAELQRYPEKTIMTRYRNAFQGAAAAGRRLAASLRIKESGAPALRAHENFTAELEELLKVIDELYSGYKSVGVTLEAAEEQLKRADAQLARIEEEQSSKLAGSKDAEKSKRIKNFKARVVEFRRHLTAQRQLIRKQRAGLLRTMQAMKTRRKEIAGLGAAKNINMKTGRTLKGARSAKKNPSAAVKVRVAPGQSAMGIALANKISFSQLMRLNPALKNNPNRLLANTAVRVH